MLYLLRLHVKLLWGFPCNLYLQTLNTEMEGLKLNRTEVELKYRNELQLN